MSRPTLEPAVAARTGNRSATLAHAATLERDAFGRGLTMSAALHRHMDLESLRGFAPFDELMRPKR